MEEEKKKVRIFKESEKNHQVTHWDMDYLTLEEVQALYNRQNGGRHLKPNRVVEFINNHIPTLMIGLGLLLLSAAIFMASFI
jgi:hypothetical protein